MEKKKYAAILAVLLLFLAAAAPVFAEGHPARLADSASLLTEEEAGVLLAKLDSISERQQVDVVVVTADTLGGKTPQEYADDYFDYNGYGMGADRDGILLLVSMEDRDWYVSTRGFGITAVTDAGLEYMSNQFLGDLSAGNYLEAFLTFAEQCDQFIAQAKLGTPYDAAHAPKEPFPWLLCIGISAAIGIIAALIITGMMKSQLKSVQGSRSAGSYIKEGSLDVTEQSDIYLYSHISRIPIPRETKPGGSGIHTSSSGASHGGGGGKF